MPIFKVQCFTGESALLIGNMSVYIQLPCFPQPCDKETKADTFLIHKDEQIRHTLSIRLPASLWFKVRCLTQTWAPLQDTSLLSCLVALAAKPGSLSNAKHKLL